MNRGGDGGATSIIVEEKEGYETSKVLVSSSKTTDEA